jgi:hypothetical protein
MGQLEGGVDPESGWVVSEVPALVKQLEAQGEVAFASGAVVQSTSSLQPEVYAVDSDERLREHQALSRESPLFSVAQAPEGLLELRLQDQGQNLRWSSWVVTSPGVVSVLSE